MGGRDNFKVTTPEDLALARGLLGGGERVGQGFDAHRLEPGRRLVLGGVELEHDRGLLGHSDADVLTHAVMDALLAAAGMGDIGQMFPDSDPAFAGADSIALLGAVKERLAGAGWQPAQVSATLLAQAPKIAPHYPAMRARLAEALGLEPGLVNVAASTTEGLGFVGRGEGMAALATARIVPR
ncbi:MAG: 2-C-methyl-D-erythritol 2,4-cyclodiphosphate synthase [Desulfarculaceae bacterium]|nr:2-C-methyl-D-erythritol 2,4-cyclodiphosphate synthase [Desulfarculaceae bacterium]